MRDVVGCYACDLSAERAALPGGSIHQITHWHVEYCTGPLGVGALIVKPRRHVVHPRLLQEPELAQMGPLLRRAAQAVRALADCDQVYACQWSHGGFEAVHLHCVVQPVHAELAAVSADAGPALQTALFRRGELPSTQAV